MANYRSPVARVDPSVSVHDYRFEPLLGTVVDLKLWGVDDALADVTADAVVGEISRLEHVFSVFDATSELCRWRSGEIDQPGAELRPLLELSLRWMAVGRGAYNPSVGVLMQRWSEAARIGVVPERSEMVTMADRLRDCPYVIDEDGSVHRRGDCRHLTFNAIAKGLIVDRAVDVAMTVTGMRAVMVNAGGDLRHRGMGTIAVGIEDPRQPHDNIAPMMVVDLGDAALATSGSARRGVRVGERWFGHVLDPRTGWPVEHLASASVVAPDAVTADVLATIVSVLEPDEAIEFIDSIDDDAACVLIGTDGHTRRSARWTER